MGSEVITSAANPLVKRVRRLLADRRYRTREQVFVVEGGQPVWRAMESGVEIEQLVVSWPLLRPDAAREMVRVFADAGGRVSEVTSEVFERMSERDGPAGVLALVRSDSSALDQFELAPDAVVVVLEHVANPGNLGTIIRTADAAGAAAVVLVGSGADPHDPAAVKASMGSVFAVPVLRCGSIPELLAFAHGHGVQVVATSGAASDTHWSLTVRRPTALLFGAEGPGLSDEALAGADATVRIPMTGSAESLNLSIAVGVTLYEVQKDALAHR